MFVTPGPPARAHAEGPGQEDEREVARVQQGRRGEERRDTDR